MLVPRDVQIHAVHSRGVYCVQGSFGKHLWRDDYVHQLRLGLIFYHSDTFAHFQSWLTIIIFVTYQRISSKFFNIRYNHAPPHLELILHHSPYPIKVLRALCAQMLPSEDGCIEEDE